MGCACSHNHTLFDGLQVGHTPLTAAASAGQVAMVSFLAQLAEVDVNARSKVGSGLSLVTMAAESHFVVFLVLTRYRVAERR